MLHEILLSLSGHPSPILRNASKDENSPAILSPPERALLKSISHLSEVHRQVIDATKAICISHESSICQAVATSIKTIQLAKFRLKILDFEQSILRKDPELVGTYNIVPLTTVVDSFSGWTRRMEWFLEICQLVQDNCTGSQMIDHLRAAIQTGYADIEVIALQLVQAAELAWLKQVSGWLLYGQLPPFGQEDFFIQQNKSEEMSEYEVRRNLLPDFVSPSTSSSILFVGKSLNQIRNKGAVPARTSSSLQPDHLKLLSSLQFPITTSSLSSAVASIRLSLSHNALQQLLPMSRICDILTILHEFFLLGRGEFGNTLVTQSDEKIRGRWRRTDHTTYDKRERFNESLVREGEVKAVLSRTWTAMTSVQNTNTYDEEQLDLARDLLHLTLSKTSSTPRRTFMGTRSRLRLALTPFNNLLLSVPTTLTLQIASPLDLFLSTSDVQVYSHISAYLLSLRRAHLRLADLWKLTSVRRSHPAPPAPPYASTVTGRAFLRRKRAREAERAKVLRNVWATSSAALFLLGEAEAYFHGEVVQGIWNGFQEWVTGKAKPSSRPATATGSKSKQEDIWSVPGKTQPSDTRPSPTRLHDFQTLSQAHRSCLAALTNGLLITHAHSNFTNSLYSLLLQVDALVNVVQRIRSIWESLDLEADDGVVDAFLDFHKEEIDIIAQLDDASAQVKKAIEAVVDALRSVDQDKEECELENATFGEGDWEEGKYMPCRVGRVDRLLMKLDFGVWLDGRGKDKDSGRDSDDNDHDDD